MSPRDTLMPVSKPGAIPVTRISGPLVSMIMAMRSDTLRTFSTTLAALSVVTCAELIRAAFMPASYSDRINSTSHRWSEIVAIILVLFFILCFC